LGGQVSTNTGQVHIQTASQG